MASNKFLFNALTVAGLGQVVAFSLLMLSTNSVLASNSSESVKDNKIQRFDLDKISVEDINKLDNQSLKTILLENKNYIANHDSHYSKHSKTSMRK